MGSMIRRGFILFVAASLSAAVPARAGVRKIDLYADAVSPRAQVARALAAEFGTPAPALAVTEGDGQMSSKKKWLVGGAIVGAIALIALIAANSGGDSSGSGGGGGY